MVVVKCTVMDCKHNFADECDLQVITVEGKSAYGIYIPICTSRQRDYAKKSSCEPDLHGKYEEGVPGGLSKMPFFATVRRRIRAFY